MDAHEDRIDAVVINDCPLCQALVYSARLTSLKLSLLLASRRAAAKLFGSKVGPVVVTGSFIAAW